MLNITHEASLSITFPTPHISSLCHPNSLFFVGHRYFAPSIFIHIHIHHHSSKHSANQRSTTSLNSINLAQINRSAAEPSRQLAAVEKLVLARSNGAKGVSRLSTDTTGAAGGSAEGAVLLRVLSVGGEGRGGGLGGEVGGEFVGWGGWVGVWGVVDGG
jgi:hypothetical protein